VKLPETWVQSRLGDVFKRVDEKINPQTSDSDSYFYLGLENLESHTGRLLLDADDVTQGNDILSIKTAFQKNDILYGKLRPNLNKVYLAEQNGICSTDIWVLRTKNIILPEFALQYLRSPAICQRATQLAVGANLPRISATSFDRLSVPLPTLPEQKRIVDTLKQVELSIQAKQSVNDQIDRLVQTAYWEHFNDCYSADGLVDPVRISDYVKDSQYGVSEAMAETGSHIVLRMNSITTSGWLNLTDFKYADLSPKDIKATRLKDGDLLFNRTNSRELVGKCALWRGEKGPYSFASYLVRLRLKDGMLPEYLWATLNSTYGKYRLLNAAKQAVSMANVSPTDLGRITVPLPPKKLQEKFAGFIKEIEQLRRKMLSKLDSFWELQTLVTQNALLGDLTKNWREANKEEIRAAAAVRDTLLRERGVKLKTAFPEPAVSKTKAIESVSPARQWLTGELSEFQRQVLAAFIDYPEQPLIVEDENSFITFCDSDEVTERLQSFGEALNNKIRRALSQLAALGLIAQVTLPKINDQTGEREYLKAFRPLREADFSRLSDIEFIKRAIKPQQEEQFHFLVNLDYETSERAGAGGMFQVISIEDEEGKDFTHLVDQGVHYPSLDELGADLASALKVSQHQIELEEV
jgi:type I restriction enzyme S subunit